MKSRRMVQSIALVFALVLLLATVAQADRIEARGTKNALSTKKRSSQKPKSTTTSSIRSAAQKGKTTQSKKSSEKTKKRSTKATSTHKAKSTSTKLDSLSTAPAKAATDESASSVFCKTFVKQCFTEALKGQTGDVVVVHSCQRNGNKDSTSYTYSCKRGKTNLVSKVLNALGNQYTVFTTVGKTTIVTGTTTEVQTAYAVQNITVLTEFSSTTVSQTQTDVSLVPTATTVVTTKIPYTATGTTTSLITETSTSTEYIAVASTTTSTAVYLGTDGVTVENVQIGDKLQRRRRGLDDFCSAFTTACGKECIGNSSKVKITVCKAKKNQEYTVACVCKNGDLLTQHALAAVVEEQYISSIATLEQSTTWITTTSTLTMSSSTSSTRFVTFTTTIPTTTTFTTLATSTIASTVTKYTGKSAVVATSDVTASSTTTVTTPFVTSIGATVTTQIVLASTGFAAATAIADGSDEGYLAATPSGYAELTGTDSSLDPLELMAVRDADTGLYQLAVFGEPRVVLITESSYDSYTTNAEAYGIMYFDSKSLCDTAGSAAGPSAGQGLYGSPCETFLFRPIADDDTLSGGTALLQGYWTNPDLGTEQTQYTFVTGQGDDMIYQVANDTAYSDTFGMANVAFNLTFPVALNSNCRRQDGNLERRC